jgi:rsbT co-antagonist protein RsbR
MPHKQQEHPMESVESVQDELARLRTRVAEIEHAERKLSVLLAVTQEGIIISEQGKVVEVSDEFVQMFGYDTEEVKAADSIWMFIAPESRESVTESIRTEYAEPYEVWALRKDGSKFLTLSRGKSIHVGGRTVRVTAIRDITQQRQLEDATRAAAIQADVIRAQEAMIAKISTPILPISERVVVMPLIGEVNEARAAHVVETLTQGIFTQQAAIAILDITGTTVVDAKVADMLIRAARASALLGTQVILTGVRSEVAQTLVNLGTELSGLITKGTLQQGIAYALSQARR